MSKDTLTFDYSTLTFDANALIPVVVQDVYSKDVLMMAYMNQEALEKTLKYKEGYYYSRKRKTLWKKGETSGNTQKVKKLVYDCDADTLLMQVEQSGLACHKNQMSCFHNTLFEEQISNEDTRILFTLYNLIKTRKQTPLKDSYTSYLFKEGIDKILKKVGEESSEVIIAAKNHDAKEITNEISDLIYHLIVLMVNENVSLPNIFEALNKRRR